MLPRSVCTAGTIAAGDAVAVFGDGQREEAVGSLVARLRTGIEAAAGDVGGATGDRLVEPV